MTAGDGAVSGVGGGPSHILLYDKPAGATSHDVVATVRRTLPRNTKVGHAGTLDPFATGLLLVLVGRATRAQRFFMALPKRYEVVARFGAVSTTGDPEGEITETGNVPAGDLTLPQGTVRQRPPAYSAVKVGAPGLRAGPGRGRGGAGRARGHRVPLRAALARRRAPRLCHRMLVGHVCQEPHRRSRRRLLPGAAADPHRGLRRRRRRPRAAGGAVGGVGVPARGPTGGRGCPARRARGPRRHPGRAGRRCRHGRAPHRRRRSHRPRRAHGRGRGSKPIVGFRG